LKLLLVLLNKPCKLREDKTIEDDNTSPKVGLLKAVSEDIAVPFAMTSHGTGLPTSLLYVKQ